MNSNKVKPEKFGHLYFVYHFTVPLKKANLEFYQNAKFIAT